jgi:hypothetical protein
VAYLLVNQIKEKGADLENFALTVASDLLLSGPQAYFHESLLESGLGSGFAPGTGYRCVLSKVFHPSPGFNI